METKPQTTKQPKLNKFARAAETHRRRKTAPPGVRKKREYDRSKTMDGFPPPGFALYSEETGPRIWRGCLLPGPETIAPEVLFDHMQEVFGFGKGAARPKLCEWSGCGSHQENLRRHVETVHLYLRLVCTDCGYKVRSDHRINSRRKAHERHCPRLHGGGSLKLQSELEETSETETEDQVEEPQEEPRERVYEFVPWAPQHLPT